MSGVIHLAQEWAPAPPESSTQMGLKCAAKHSRTAEGQRGNKHLSEGRIKLSEQVT